MSDEKYRQISSQRENCKQGHWTGIPTGGSGGGCWLCKYGCAVLSYLKWKGKEPNEENVTGCLNNNADADWGKMHISKHTEFQAPCIGRLKYSVNFTGIALVAYFKPELILMLIIRPIIIYLFTFFMKSIFLKNKTFISINTISIYVL